MNKFTEYLFNFGNKIKKQGEVVYKNDNEEAYKIHTEDYDYTFRLTDLGKIKVGSIMVILNQGTKFAPIMQLEFSDHDHFTFSNNAELSRIAKEEIKNEKTR